MVVHREDILMIIPGFENYDISEDGIVTKVDTGKVLRRFLYTLPSGKQYYHVSLMKDKRTGGMMFLLRSERG